MLRENVFVMFVEMSRQWPLLHADLLCVVEYSELSVGI